VTAHSARGGLRGGDESITKHDAHWNLPRMSVIVSRVVAFREHRGAALGFVSPTLDARSSLHGRGGKLMPMRSAGERTG